MVRWIFLFAFLLCLAAAIYFWLMRTSIVEHFLSKRLNTKVTIVAVDLTWKQVTFHGFKIKSPARAALPFTFEAEKITLEMENLLELAKKRVHINRICIEDAVMGLELYNPTGSDNNWSRQLNNISLSDDKYFSIDRLEICNLSFHAIRSSGKVISIPSISHLQFDHLGSSHPLTAAEVTKITFEGILMTLTTRPYLGALLDSVKTLPKGLFEEVQTTFEESTKSPFFDSFEALKKKTFEASSYIHSLFAH